jgi:hypothetical protein
MQMAEKREEDTSSKFQTRTVHAEAGIYACGNAKRFNTFPIL